MKIIVLMKQVPDTYEERKLDPATGILDRDASEPIIDEVGERALELALRYKDAHKEAEVVMLSMGPDSVTASLRKGLSLGADSAMHVLDDALAGADLGWTAAVLAAALTQSGYDLVVAGNESTDGRGGVIAGDGGRAPEPCPPHRTGLGRNRRRSKSAGCEGPRAEASACTQRCRPSSRSPSAHPRCGSRTSRASSRRRRNRSPCSRSPTSASTRIPSLRRGASVVVSTTERPARTAGTKIVDDGNAGVELAEFLAAGHLI